MIFDHDFIDLAFKPDIIIPLMATLLVRMKTEIQYEVTKEYLNYTLRGQLRELLSFRINIVEISLNEESRSRQ